MWCHIVVEMQPFAFVKIHFYCRVKCGYSVSLFLMISKRQYFDDLSDLDMIESLKNPASMAGLISSVYPIN